MFSCSVVILSLLNSRLRSSSCVSRAYLLLLHLHRVSVRLFRLLLEVVLDLFVFAVPVDRVSLFFVSELLDERLGADFLELRTCVFASDLLAFLTPLGDDRVDQVAVFLDCLVVQVLLCDALDFWVSPEYLLSS